ncbi:DNA polymerase IV [Candidatus Margulisiibacteriota bacterium]
MQRSILLVDMNAFFASVEQAVNPSLRGKPIAVGGGVKKRSVVAAASYEAKVRGIKTAMSSREAKKICPELIMVIGDMTKYIYTSTEIVKIFNDYTDLVEVFSIDEAFLDVTKTKDRFGGELQIAREIKRRIRERFHITCTIGIGPNKLMAKLACELQKPDGLVVISEEDIPARIQHIPVGDLCGIGRKYERYLGNMGIRTFGDLNKYPREKLVKRFGAFAGEHLYYMGQGWDNSEVLPNDFKEVARSMGHSYTLPKNSTDHNEVKSYLLRLSEQVGRRLRKHNYKGNVVHLYIRYGDFSGFGQQKRLPDYLNDGYDIYLAAEKILEREMGGERWEMRDGIRLVGVSLSGLIHNMDQISIFDKEERKKKILKAVDEVNNRYGEFTIERMAIMNTVLHGKVGMVSQQMYKPQSML